MVTERSSQHWDTPLLSDTIPEVKVKRKGPEPKFRARVVKDGDKPWADLKRFPVRLSPIVVHDRVLPVHFMGCDKKCTVRPEGTGKPGTAWTEWQYATAYQMYKEGKNLDEIGEAIGRSGSSVQKMMSKQGVKRARKLPPVRKYEPTFWNKDRVETLRKMAKGGYYLSEMAEEFNLKPESIRRVCRIHNIQYRLKPMGGSANPYTQEEDDLVKQLWRDGVSIREIAERLGRPLGGVRARLERLRRRDERKD